MTLDPGDRCYYYTGKPLYPAVVVTPAQVLALGGVLSEHPELLSIRLPLPSRRPAQGA